MNRAADSATAAMFRLSAIGARNAFERISRMALIPPPWCDAITDQAPSIDRAAVPRVVSGPPWVPSLFQRPYQAIDRDWRDLLPCSRDRKSTRLNSSH